MYGYPYAPRNVVYQQNQAPFPRPAPPQRWGTPMHTYPGAMYQRPPAMYRGPPYGPRPGVMLQHRYPSNFPRFSPPFRPPPQQIPRHPPTPTTPSTPSLKDGLETFEDEEGMEEDDISKKMDVKEYEWTGPDEEYKDYKRPVLDRPELQDELPIISIGSDDQDPVLKYSELRSDGYYETDVPFMKRQYADEEYTVRDYEMDEEQDVQPISNEDLFSQGEEITEQDGNVSEPELEETSDFGFPLNEKPSEKTLREIERIRKLVYEQQEKYHGIEVENWECRIDWGKKEKNRDVDEKKVKPVVSNPFETLPQEEYFMNNANRSRHEKRKSAPKRKMPVRAVLNIKMTKALVCKDDFEAGEIVGGIVLDDDEPVEKLNVDDKARRETVRHIRMYRKRPAKSLSESVAASHQQNSRLPVEPISGHKPFENYPDCNFMTSGFNGMQNQQQFGSFASSNYMPSNYGLPFSNGSGNQPYGAHSSSVNSTSTYTSSSSGSAPLPVPSFLSGQSNGWSSSQNGTKNSTSASSASSGHAGTKTQPQIKKMKIHIASRGPKRRKIVRSTEWGGFLTYVEERERKPEEKVEEKKEEEAPNNFDFAQFDTMHSRDLTQHGEVEGEEEDDEETLAILHGRSLPRFKPINKEFQSMKWLDEICYDGPDPKKPPKQHALILDINDEKMIFEDPNNENLQNPAKLLQHLSGRADKEEEDVVYATAYDTDSDDDDEEGTGGRHRSGLDVPERNRYNLGNDEYYTASMRGRMKGSVQHSLVAVKLPQELYPTRQPPNALRIFHRPVLMIPANVYTQIARLPQDKDKSLIITKMPSSNPNAPPIDVYQKREDWTKKTPKKQMDLTARDGRVVLLEYIEQHPPLLSKIGMSTHLTTYYRQRNSNDSHIPKEFSLPVDKHGTEVVKIPRSDGDMRILDAESEAPTFGDIFPGKPLMVMENNLFAAPVFPHLKSETDFLLTRAASGGFFYIREIPQIYTVGQTQPKMTVPEPHTSHSEKILKRRIKVAICRALTERRTVRIPEICEQFDCKKELVIGIMKECAEADNAARGTLDEHKVWKKKPQELLPTEVELQDLMTPDDVCRYDAMQAAEQRLIDMGITQLSLGNDFTRAIDKINGGSDENLKEVANFIREELERAPWSLTKGFVNARDGQGIVMLEGNGNPMDDGEAFSFLSSTLRDVKGKEDSKSLIKSQSRLTGTKNDLRALTMPQAERILRDFGMKKSSIKKLNRWARVKRIKYLSNKAVESGASRDMKFARKEKHGSQQDLYRKRISDIWKNHLHILSSEKDPRVATSQILDIEGLLEDHGDAKPKNKSKKSSEESDGHDIEDEEKEANEFLKDRNSRDKEGSKDKASKMEAISKTPEPSATQKPTPVDESPSVERPKRLVKKKRNILRITRLYNDARGERKDIEYIRDPEKINEYLESYKKRQMQLANDPAAKKAKKKRDAKERKRLEKRALLERKKEELIKASEKEDTLTCGACGMRGHMKTNRLCPAYKHNHPEEENSQALGIIEDRGGSFSINRKKMEEYAPRQYQRTHIRPGQGPRMRGDHPRLKFSTILCGAVEELKKHPQCMQTFWEDPTNIANYNHVITNPMSVSLLYERAKASATPKTVEEITKRKTKPRRFRYSRLDEFTEDLELLESNSRSFNGVEAQVTKAAQQIVRIGMEYISRHSGELHDLQVDLSNREEERQLVHFLTQLVHAMKKGRFEYFKEDVDIKKTPTYAKIKKPMSLATITHKIRTNQYQNVTRFSKDCHLIVQNSISFNGVNSHITENAQTVLQEAQRYFTKNLPFFRQFDSNSDRIVFYPVPKVEESQISRQMKMEYKTTFAGSVEVNSNSSVQQSTRERIGFHSNYAKKNTKPPKIPKRKFQQKRGYDQFQGGGGGGANRPFNGSGNFSSSRRRY